ncbi:MAG: hypothetical protein U0172_08970 [Nitrospiraceae bacterium]
MTTSRPSKLCVVLLFIGCLTASLLGDVFASLFGLGDSATAIAATKRKSGPRKDPDLKIVDVVVKPLPYSPQQGPLEFVLTLDLPPTVDPASLLEVTALISSPSRSSLRFLSYRNPVGPLLSAIPPAQRTLPVQPASAASEKPPSPRVRITLTWDGKDHTKQDVPSGPYQYELRAKVIAGGDSTPRALTVAWPKRGTLTVK